MDLAILFMVSGFFFLTYKHAFANIYVTTRGGTNPNLTEKNISQPHPFALEEFRLLSSALSVSGIISPTQTAHTGADSPSWALMAFPMSPQESAIISGN